jgi:hypothetical protein
MKYSLRSLLLALIAGSSLLLLSGCADLEIHDRGPYHHRVAYGYGYARPAYGYGYGYDDGYYGARRPYYGSRTVVVSPGYRSSYYGSPYYRSGYARSPYYGGRRSTVVVSTGSRHRGSYYRY